MFILPSSYVVYLLPRLFGFLFIIKSQTFGISISSGLRRPGFVTGVGSNSPVNTPVFVIISTGNFKNKCRKTCISCWCHRQFVLQYKWVFKSIKHMHTQMPSFLFNMYDKLKYHNVKIVDIWEIRHKWETYHMQRVPPTRTLLSRSLTKIHLLNYLNPSQHF